MTQKRRLYIPSAEKDPVDAKPSVEDQAFRLLDLQLTQGLELENKGLAAKAREDLLSRVRMSRERLDGSSAEGVEVDLDVDLSQDTDLSRVVAALDTENDGDVRFAGIRFTTVSMDAKGKPWQGKAFVAVAVGPLTNGLRNFTPVHGYTPDDAAVVTGMLEKVQEDRDKGLLPDIGDDLATINDPEGQMNIPNTPPIMPRF